jgi:hypothetical protein
MTIPFIAPIQNISQKPHLYFRMENYVLFLVNVSQTFNYLAHTHFTALTILLNNSLSRGHPSLGRVYGLK